MSYDFNDYKKDATDRPSSKAWGNWKKFEKVGDSVQGYIRDVFYRPAEGIYKEARGITLEQPDGSLINVSIKRYDFILAKTDRLRLGDPLTMVFEEELPAKKPGFNKTKQFGFYGKNLPENAGNKTVAELDALDRGMGALSKSEADREFDAIPGAGEQPAAEAPAQPQQ
jgi:hypothetical protein